MNAEQILAIVEEKGVILEAHNGKIHYRAPAGTLTQDLIKALKANKKDLLSLIYAKMVPTPGDCESCPAGGFWDYLGPDKFCFHTAYYLGKAGKPIPCEIAWRDCPLS